jgi:hypothetical protein
MKTSAWIVHMTIASGICLWAVVAFTGCAGGGGGTLDTSPGTPVVEFTSVPAYGSNDQLRGVVRHIAKAADFRIAIYISVDDGWWTKPYFATPTTTIAPDGSWACDVVTGGIDQYATQLEAFLIPASYSPPLLASAASFPADLLTNAVAQAVVSRSPTP